MQQEISHAKTIQVGPAADVRESCMNPDTTSGLFVTSEICAHARRVDVLKNLDKQEAKERAVRTVAKNAVLSTKKKEAFDRIINSIVKEADNDMVKALTSHVPKTDIKLAFQHAGGQPKDCKDGRFQTYIDAIVAGFFEFFREAAIQRTNDSTNDTPSTADTSNACTNVVPDSFEEEYTSTEEMLLAEV